MSDHKLSAGAIEKLQNIDGESEALLNQNYTFQILSVKSVAGGVGNQPARYRFILSDGVGFMQAMLATQMNHLIDKDEVQKHTVVEVTRLSANMVQGKRVLIIMGLEVVGHVAEKIGAPTGGATPQAAAAPAAPTARPSASAATAGPSANTSSRPSGHQPTKKHISLFPIEALSPYQNNWTIKARVIQKSEIRKYSNARGEGQFFNVTLMDETGEIRGTAWNTAVDELYPKFEENKAYYVSKARVNLAKKKFSTVSNDYELGLEKTTEIEECTDTADIPQVKYDFQKIDALQQLAKDSLIDVIGVVTEVTDVTPIVTKAQKQLFKRELTLADDSVASVRVTLWGKQAEDYKADLETPVIAFKGVKLGDFGGRSLSMIGTSTMAINPDIGDAHSLSGWYAHSGSGTTFASQTTGGPGGARGFNRDQVMTLIAVRDTGVGEPTGKEYFDARATIMHIKGDGTLMYPACPAPNCNKKVTPADGEGKWSCEKCDKVYDEPQYRYIISMCVADETTQLWFQGFNEVGEAAFGITANAMHVLNDLEDTEPFKAAIAKAMYKRFNFSCRAKQDTYNETTRTRYGISRLSPPNYKDEIVALLGTMKNWKS